jgi:hypothetical protein
MEGLIFFPLKILKRRRTAANFSLNKDGGVFNGTMYILSTFSYKNTLRIKRRWEGLFFSLHTLCIEKSHPYLWLKISLHKICRAEYMRVIFSFLLWKYKDTTELEQQSQYFNSPFSPWRK